jgi:hypothetical protein
VTVADADAAGFAPFFGLVVVCARARGAMASATRTSVAPRVWRLMAGETSRARRRCG